MMFQLGDYGVVSSVNEDDLIYVDKNELEQFIESYQELEKENEQLKRALLFYLDISMFHSGSRAFDKNMDKWCKLLLGCSYKDAKAKWGEFKYAQRWELE